MVQCATAAMTKRFQKFQEVFCILEAYCGSPDLRHLSQHTVLTSSMYNYKSHMINKFMHRDYLECENFLTDTTLNTRVRGCA